MRHRLGRRRSQERGQSLVEVALIAPVVLLILLLAVDFGRVFLGWVTVTNVARIGANYAAVNPQGFQDRDAGVIAAYHNLMLGDATGTDCALEDPLPNPNFSGYELGDDVTASVSCEFPLLTPLL